MIRITLEDQERDMLYVQGLPRMAGRFFPLTHDGMREAMIACGKQPYTIDGALLEWCAPVRPKTIMLPAEYPALANLVTPQWEHQKAGTYLIMTRGGVLIAADMGTGKTKMLIDAAQNLGCKRTLIVAPKAVTKNWPREVALHAVPAYRHLLANDVDQSMSFRAHQIMAFAGPHTAFPDMPEIIAVDHATCWRDDIAELLLKYEWDMIAVDEAHKICDPSNKLSQFIYQLAARNPEARRVALTGTPFDKMALKVFGIARFVAPEIVGTNKWAFDHKYGVFKKIRLRTKQGMDREIEKFDRLADREAFTQMVAQFTFHVSESVMPDLPERTHTRRYAFLTATQRSQYKRLAKEWEAEVKGKTLSASSAAIMVMRLQQFTGLLKGDLLAETLEVLDGQPCVIFARFAEDLAIIRDVCKKAGLIYLEQSGNASEWERWQDGEGDVLGVQEQSGGMGINLTRAHTAIFYSHERREIEYKQSLKRLHRPGQTRHVSYIHLCVDNTIDDGVIDALQSGCDATDAILKQVHEENERETLRNAA